MQPFNCHHLANCIPLHPSIPPFQAFFIASHYQPVDIKTILLCLAFMCVGSLFFTAF